MDHGNIDELNQLAPKDHHTKIELLGNYYSKNDKIILDPYFVSFFVLFLFLFFLIKNILDNSIINYRKTVFMDFNDVMNKSKIVVKISLIYKSKR